MKKKERKKKPSGLLLRVTEINLSHFFKMQSRGASDEVEMVLIPQQREHESER